jgi:Big-like domain-containing protein
VSTGIDEGMGASQLTLADPAGVGAGTLGVPAFVWLSEQGVEVRFASNLAQSADNGADTVERVLVGPGEGKSSLQLAGAGEAIGVAWQEVSASGHGVIKLRGVSHESGLLGTEITVGGATSQLSHHSLSISGYRLSEEATSGAAHPTSGLNLVWVASDASDAPGVGRIMMQRFAVLHDEDGAASGLMAIDAAGRDAFHRIAHQTEVAADLSGAANDNAVWVGDEDGSGGAIGQLPTVATLDTGDVLVAWIGAEGHVHGKLYTASDDNGAAAPGVVAVNEALADLTPDYHRDGQGQDARRVKVGDLGPGTFALVWMVAAGADAMLNGSLFSLHADEAGSNGASGEWTQTSLAPVPLPAGFTGEFQVSAADGQDPDLVISYEATDSAGNVTTTTVTQTINPVAEPAAPGKEAPADVGDKPDTTMPVHKAHANGSSSPFSAPEQHDSFAVHSDPLPQPTATHHVGEGSELTVTANDNGLAAMFTVPGSSADAVGLRIKLLPANGAGADDGPVINVTDNADPDVAPAVARVGDGGVVVAWVDATSGELRAQSFTADGQAEAAGGGMTVASGHTVSDIALADNSVLAAAEAAAAAAYANEFALAWVQDAGLDGYGYIMLQRYLLPQVSGAAAAADDTPVGLGRDGNVDGNDAPEQFSVDHGNGPVGVIGRAPQLAGLQQGQLAMSWVENDGSLETVKGAILERDGGRAILNIDLSAQLNEAAVVAKGTHPILSSAANGDILVAWLQPDGSDGFDIKAAVYKVAGEGVWSLPDRVLELQHFASQPNDFSLGFAGDADLSLLLTWESNGGGSSSWGQRFDLDGASLGTSFSIRDGQADVAADTTSLPDGSIVVVYAEQDKNGNVDIESHVVPTGDASSEQSPLASDIFGALDTHAGLGDYGSLSSGSPHANDKDITVVEDATDGVIIDVLNEQTDGLRVVQVNGADLAIGAPLRIEHGFVQLRDDGDLLFTADENFHGTVNFEYTVSNDDAQLATASVAVNVTPVEDDPMPVDLAFDQGPATSGTSEASPLAPPDHQGPADQPPANDATAQANDQAVDHSGPGSQPASETQPGNVPAQPNDQAVDNSGSGSQPAGEAQPGNVLAGATAEVGAAGDHDASHEAGDDGAATTAQAASSGMDETNDTLTFTARYEYGYRPGSVERQWLQLDYDANRDARGDVQWPGGNPDAPTHDNDTFVFHAAFGNDATAEARGVDHVIDLSKSGYPTFQALQDAGALVQVGEDVEITLNVVDPTHPEKILLRSISLSTLTASDFKFS